MTEGMKGSNTRLCLRSNCTVHSLLLACNFLYSQKQPSAGKGGGVAKVKKNWEIGETHNFSHPVGSYDIVMVNHASDTLMMKGS